MGRTKVYGFPAFGYDRAEQGHEIGAGNFRMKVRALRAAGLIAAFSIGTGLIATPDPLNAQAVEVDLSVLEKIKRPVAVGGDPIVLRPPAGDGATVLRKRKVKRRVSKAKKTVAKAPEPKKPEPKAKVEPKAEKQPETASVPKKPVTPPPPPSTLAFAGGSADLQAPAAGKLGPVLGYLGANPETRVQITGYAPGEGTEAGAARRLSLARARAVQTWLAGKGVDASRIVLRALGNKAGTANPDRVDVSILKK